MDSLGSLSVFVQVAQTLSFTAAGRVLGVSSSAVGKSIARMEERLGVRLFHRSTRSITLTSEGALFLERSRRILAEVEAAEQELTDAAATPRGKLRISVPQVRGLLMPVLSDFMRAYPEIELDVDFSDRMVDVIEEGFDAVIRTGKPEDSRLMARHLGHYQLVLVATPGTSPNTARRSNHRTSMATPACATSSAPRASSSPGRCALPRGLRNRCCVRRWSAPPSSPSSMWCSRAWALPACRTTWSTRPWTRGACNGCWMITWNIGAVSGCCGPVAIPRPRYACLLTICAPGFSLQAPVRSPVTFYRQECARQGLVLLHNTAQTVFLRIINVDIIPLA